MSVNGHLQMRRVRQRFQTKGDRGPAHAHPHPLPAVHLHLRQLHQVLCPEDIPRQPHQVAQDGTDERGVQAAARAAASEEPSRLTQAVQDQAEAGTAHAQRVQEAAEVPRRRAGQQQQDQDDHCQDDLCTVSGA